LRIGFGFVRQDLNSNQGRDRGFVGWVVGQVGAESFEVLEILYGAAMESFGLGLVAEENGDDVGLPVQAADTLAGPIGAEIRAVCGNSARTDLCGGCRAPGIPTATGHSG